MKYLNKKYTLDELRMFGKDTAGNGKEFREFIFNASFSRPVASGD